MSSDELDDDDDDDNVVEHPTLTLATGIPVDFVMQSLDLGNNSPAPAAREQNGKTLRWGEDGCRHDRYQVAVDLSRRTLICGHCKGAVDPLAYIAHLAKEWERIKGWEAHARAERHRHEEAIVELKKEAAKLRAEVQKHHDMLVAMNVRPPSPTEAMRMGRARRRR